MRIATLKYFTCFPSIPVPQKTKKKKATLMSFARTQAYLVQLASPPEPKSGKRCLTRLSLVCVVGRKWGGLMNNRPLWNCME